MSNDKNNVWRLFDKTGKTQYNRIILSVILIFNFMSKQTQGAVVANAVENATAAVNANEKGAKVTTFEELFAGHANLPRTEQGAIILTDELFRNLAASHTYKYGQHVFKVLEKRSGTERGGKTLYKVQSGADTFEDFSIEELKQEFGCEYRRAKDGSSNSKTALGKAKYATDKLSEVIAECEDEELTKAYNQLKGLVSLKRAEEQKREQEERESERADKSADKMSDAALLAELKKRGLI